MKLAIAALLAGSAAAFNVKEVRFVVGEAMSFFQRIAWSDNWRIVRCACSSRGQPRDVRDLVRGQLRILI